jgi:TatD DNase family protein
MLIDSHAHLEMPDFKRDLEQVIQRAKESGVGYIFTVGTEKKDWKRTLEIANSNPSIYAILGVHPHNAKEIDDQTYPVLREHCRNGKVKAYGEIGLDFFRNLSARDVQLERFREQIGLAKELGLPIVVHDREAHRETLEVLRSEMQRRLEGSSTAFLGMTRWQGPAWIWDSISLSREASPSRMRRASGRWSREFHWSRF